MTQRTTAAASTWSTRRPPSLSRKEFYHKPCDTLHSFTATAVELELATPAIAARLNQPPKAKP